MSSKRRGAKKQATSIKSRPAAMPVVPAGEGGTTEGSQNAPLFFEPDSDSDDGGSGVRTSATLSKHAADDESSDVELVDSMYVDTIADDGESTASSDDLSPRPMPPTVGLDDRHTSVGVTDSIGDEDDGGPATVSSNTIPAKRPASPAVPSAHKKAKNDGNGTHTPVAKLVDNRVVGAAQDPGGVINRDAHGRTLTPAVKLPDDGDDRGDKLRASIVTSTSDNVVPGRPELFGAGEDSAAVHAMKQRTADTTKDTGRVSSGRIVRNRRKEEPAAAVLPSFETHTVDEDDSSWKTVTSYEVPATVIPGTDQTQLDEFVDGEKILEGSVDSSLWDRSLRDMYMEYYAKAPQVNVGYGGHAQQQLDGPRFDEWVHLKTMVPFLRKVLKFDNNPFYINPSRASPLLFDIYDPSDSGPYRNDQYLSLRYTTNPAVCISLVQVRLSRLYTPEAFLKYGTTDQYYDKKTIVANMFPQEQNFWNSNIGAVFDVPNIVLPIWPIKDTPMALSFQTRPTKKMNVPTSWGGSGKRGGNYKEHLTPSAKKTQGAVSLWANTTIPLFDGRKHILDLSKPLYDLGLPALDFEPPRESLGVIFYTIVESRKLIPEISLNVMGFVLLATPDDLAAARRST
ncbi:hypothetical protein EXIGLDRAFT_767252 [Exidia glandulosa HHB12029]|uniref:Uncharacterized protein n=1 Tax=Exidia glandulosa HHB12029 TaxID=1314781 RepID=A0A165J3X3_EXIGL|nr:hypothetical protein EXIGLDRAFT_767252 [Exidia glandulosa HHB12029]